MFGVFTCRPIYFNVVFGECVRLFVHTLYIYFNGQHFLDSYHPNILYSTYWCLAHITYHLTSESTPQVTSTFYDETTVGRELDHKNNQCVLMSYIIDDTSIDCSCIVVIYYSNRKNKNVVIQ